jgi:hypothetical protein
MRMPVKMLGKVAMRTIKDVRTLINKDRLPLLRAPRLLQATNGGNGSNTTSNGGATTHRSSTTASSSSAAPPAVDAINNLKKVVKQSREVLCQANTVILPMNLFPDTVMVDRTRITIVKRTFFWSASVISISIDDVLNVSTSVGPFFGSVTVSSRVMNSTDHFQIDYFWRKDALHLKHIIQGYVIAHQNNIATDQLGRDQLIETLLELGKEDNS